MLPLTLPSLPLAMSILTSAHGATPTPSQTPVPQPTITFTIPSHGASTPQQIDLTAVFSRAVADLLNNSMTVTAPPALREPGPSVQPATIQAVVQVPTNSQPAAPNAATAAAVQGNIVPPAPAQQPPVPRPTAPTNAGNMQPATNPPATNPPAPAAQQPAPQAPAAQPPATLPTYTSVDLQSATKVIDRGAGTTELQFKAAGGDTINMDLVGGRHPSHYPIIIDHKSKLPPPDKYDGGTTGSIRNVNIWCTDILRYVRRTGIDIADAMAALTTGRARELVDMMLRDPAVARLSADDFLNVFAAHFSGQTQPTHLQARDKLHNQTYIMVPGQPLADYVLSFKQIMIEAGSMAETDRIRWFQQGLLPELRAECLTDGLASAFTSLDALIQHAFAQDRKLQCRYSAATSALHTRAPYPTLAVADAEQRIDPAAMQDNVHTIIKPAVTRESYLPEYQPPQQYDEYQHRDTGRSVRGRGPHGSYITTAPYNDPGYGYGGRHSSSGRGRGSYPNMGRGRGAPAQPYTRNTPRVRFNNHPYYAPEPAWHEPADPFWQQPQPQPRHQPRHQPPQQQAWHGPPPQQQAQPPAPLLVPQPPPPPRPSPNQQPQQPAAGTNYEAARQQLAAQFKACPICLEIHPNGPCPRRSDKP